MGKVEGREKRQGKVEHSKGHRKGWVETAPIHTGHG